MTATADDAGAPSPVLGTELGDDVLASVEDDVIMGWGDESHARMLLTGLVAASGDPLFIKDADLRFVVANRAAARSHQLELPSQLLGRRDAEMLAPDIARLVEHNDRTVMATGLPMESVGHLDTPDGRRLFATRRTPLVDRNGDVIGVLGTARDITEQRRAEDALTTSEERYRAIVESSASIVWVTDLQGCIVENTPAWTAYTGQPFAEHRGHGWLDVIHPDDRAAVLAARRHASRHADRYEVRYRLWNAEQQAYRHVVARGTLRRDSAGRSVEWLGVLRDNDEQARRDVVLRSHQRATAGLAALGVRLARTHGFDEAIGEMPPALESMLGAVNVHVHAGTGPWPARPDVSRWLHQPSTEERLIEAEMRTLVPDHRGVRTYSRGSQNTEGGALTGLVVPVAPNVRILGSISILWSEATVLDGTIVDSVVAAAQMLGDALQRSTQHDEEHRFAEEFQRALLQPLHLPDEYEVAARYDPAAISIQMGGDWYDSVTRSDGRTTVVIGDVTGHGAEAAADMAGLRAVMATLLALNLPLSETIEKASALHSRRGGVASAVVLELDPRQHTLTHLSAGHAPFIVCRQDGTIDVVEAPRRPLLGIGNGRSTHADTMPFATGDLLVAFTDGLIERANESLDDAIARLAAEVTNLRHLPCKRLVDILVEHVRPTGGDDVALLAIRCRPTPVLPSLVNPSAHW